jgi:hypothetical protein
MDAYRLNIRLNRNNPEHRRIAEYLDELSSSRNRFVISAIAAQMDREENAPLTESAFRRILRDELQNFGALNAFSPVSPEPDASRQSLDEMPAEGDAERNQELTLAALALFG